jgi:hypothetical protein
VSRRETDWIVGREECETHGGDEEGLADADRSEEYPARGRADASPTTPSRPSSLLYFSPRPMAEKNSAIVLFTSWTGVYLLSN